MELIFGGAYQGKTQYAAQKYDLTDADIFTCEGLDLDPDARCIRHLERFARACTEAGLDVREEFARRSPRACVLSGPGAKRPADFFPVLPHRRTPSQEFSAGCRWR